MIDFSKISKNLIGVSLVSALMIFWLGSRYLIDTYTQYSDSGELRQSVFPEILLFDVAHNLTEERDGIQRSLVSATQDEDEFSDLNQSRQQIRDAFKDARSEIMLTPTAESVDVLRQFEEIDAGFSRLSFSSIIIKQQLYVPVAARDEYVRMQLYDNYNSLISSVNALRKKIHILPNKNYVDVLSAHQLKNSLWTLNDSINQISILIETFLNMNKHGAIKSLNVDNLALRIFQQQDLALQAFSSLEEIAQNSSGDSFSDRELTNLKTLYQSHLQAPSKQHLLSEPEDLNPNKLLPQWLETSDNIKQGVGSLVSSALSNTVSTANSIRRSAIASLFVNAALVLLCMALAYATYKIARTIQHQADHDELTGMPNRRYFNVMLESLCKKARGAKNQKVVLMTMDLNGFKTVNDTMGHVAGDQLLIQVAQRLVEAVGEGKTLARMGGDEFAIAYATSDSLDQPCQFAQKIQDVFNPSFSIEDGSVKIDTSIGYSVYPNDADTLKSLQITSDFAMFSAKQSGRKTIQPYDREIAAKFENRIAVEKDLVVAIENNELELEFQPQFDLKRNHANAVEALVRWQHPTRGRVPPTEFIDVAEETGLMPSIGAWVLNEACRQVAVWNIEKGQQIRVAVNVSVYQMMQNEFVQDVINTIEHHKISASWLELEITESVVMTDIKWIVSCLNELKAYGVRIALDDFGTGYSSLNQLQQLPLDTLKIDRSFIEGLGDDSERMNSVTATIASIADIYGLETVAEGIETEKQLLEVNKLGIDVAQGYYYSKPLPKDDVIATIDEINQFTSVKSNKAA